MKKRWTTSIKLLLCCLFCVTILAIGIFSASAESYSGNCGANGDNLTWSLDTETGELVIDGTGAMADYMYASAPWHSYCSMIHTVTIGDGVTSIGASAFEGCASLVSVTIGDGVTSLGAYAFYSCGGLANVTIGNGVTSIGEGAFFECLRLASVTIGDGVESIGDSAFYYCLCLERVDRRRRDEHWQFGVLRLRCPHERDDSRRRADARFFCIL